MEATQLMRHVQQMNAFYVLLIVILKLFENTFMLHLEKNNFLFKSC